MVEFATEEGATSCVEGFNRAQQGTNEDDRMVAMMQSQFEEERKMDRLNNAFGILLISGIPTDAGLSWSDLWELMRSMGGLYLNYVAGEDSDCLVRFADPGKVMGKFENEGVYVCGSRLSAEMLDGMEEAKYWKYVNEKSAPPLELAVGPMERILSKTQVKKPASTRGRALELTELPADINFRKCWNWICGEELGVRFLKMSDDCTVATLFFEDNQKMEKLVAHLENEGLFMGAQVKHRVWTDDEAKEYWRNQKIARRAEQSSSSVSSDNDHDIEKPLEPEDSLDPSVESVE